MRPRCLPISKKSAHDTERIRTKNKPEGKFMPSNDYTFVPDLLDEFAIPENGIASRVLHKDERFNIILFGFSPGKELSTHSVPTPALISVLEGEGEIDLGSDTIQVNAGSFIRMTPFLSHAVRAKTPFRMLLVQVKDGTHQKIDPAKS